MSNNPHNVRLVNVPVTRAANSNQDPLGNIRNQLFNHLFLKASISYARTFPPAARRFFEFLFLIKALGALSILIYIHTAIYAAGCQCLDHVKDNWPRDGILRVELIRHPYPKSFNETIIGHKNKTADDINVLFDNLPWNQTFSNNNCDLTSTYKRTKSQKCFDDQLVVILNDADFIARRKNATEYLMQQEANEVRDRLTEIEMLASAIWQQDEYVFEYALEYGLLRLSSNVRQKLKIPVKVIKLDPTKDECFGDPVSKFIMEEFLGYNDVLISCMKHIATHEDNRGYLRNVLTGEHYQFVKLWMPKSSFLCAAFTMLVFTLSISMLLRYSHHQVFIFIVDVLQMLEFNTSISFPTAPLFTVILALVGMEAIMTEFFNETTTAFYIIIIVWACDQFNAVCCRTPITRKHWPRFFYLYHFAFYAYHYRFNGLYYELALITSWLFIQHSMLYFFHHYELPPILAEVNNNPPQWTDFPDHIVLSRNAQNGPPTQAPQSNINQSNENTNIHNQTNENG